MRPFATPTAHIRQALAVLAAITVVVLFALSIRRRGSVLEVGLRDWAIGEVAGATDSVYQLALAGVRLDVFAGRMIIDSLRLVTDTARNDYRADRYPVLTAEARGCRITGIDTWALLMARGVKADLFRCDDIAVSMAEVARPEVPTRPATENPRSGVPFLRDSLTLPALVPRIEITETQLPRLSLAYARRGAGGYITRVSLERLAIALHNTRIDEAGSGRGRKPLFSESAVVTADTLQVSNNKQQSIVLGRAHLNLTDSTLVVDSIVAGPRETDAEWIKLQKRRRDLIRMRIDSVRFQGVDYRRLVSAEGGIVIRNGAIHGLELDVYSDKRLPKGSPKVRRTPQQWLADLERPVRIDTLRVNGGRIAYREQGLDRPSPGIVSWDSLRVDIANFATIGRGSASAPPMSFHAIAMLQGTGRLETTIIMPLAARQFDMQYTGTLGPMNLEAFNRFAERRYQMKITSGTLSSVKFTVQVRNGRSTGTVVPVYDDFKVALQDKKGSFFKKAGLSIASFFANTFKVRDDNPDEEGERPLVGAINQPYDRSQALPGVFWFALREGLFSVFMR